MTRRDSHDLPEAFSEQEIARIGALLATAREQEGLARFGPHGGWANEDLARLGKLLRDAREAKVVWFDPFTLSGWRPKENDLNRALASLLDPAGGHGFGHIPLLALLSAAEGTATSVQQTRVAAIREHLGQAEKCIVLREYPRGESRPDICILGSEFAIFLENKIRGGIETWTDRKSQTSRHAELLDGFTAERGISPDLSLVLLLSPRGTAAISDTHVAVPLPTFLDAIHDMLPEAIRQTPNALQTLAYLSWHERMSI